MGFDRPSEQTLVQQPVGDGMPRGQRQQKWAWAAVCGAGRMQVTEMCTRLRERNLLFMNSIPLYSIKPGWTDL